MQEEAGSQPAIPLERVYLMGFMGAGKTTVGALLAALLDWQFIDVDAWIEKQQNTSIAALFAAHGEAGFRRIEQQAMQTLQTAKGSVLSLGGGAIETEDVRMLLASDEAATTVFLDAPLDLLIARCEAQGGVQRRPLLAEGDLLGTRYQKRVARYRMAHLTVATENRTPEEVAALIHACMAASARYK